MIVLLEIGAGNEVRTRGLDLGKVALYQLSYTRGSIKLYSYVLYTKGYKGDGVP